LSLRRVGAIAHLPALAWALRRGLVCLSLSLAVSGARLIGATLERN